MLLLNPDREIGANQETIMGNVIISPNIRKESVTIDPSGNEINPRTKQIVKALEPEFIEPTAPTPIVNPVNNTTVIPEVKTSKIDELINKKIEELVARKIEEALSKL